MNNAHFLTKARFNYSSLQRPLASGEAACLLKEKHALLLQFLKALRAAFVTCAVYWKAAWERPLSRKRLKKNPTENQEQLILTKFLWAI